MTPSRRPRSFLRLDGLAPRVAAFLTIALLPLGLIALYQTREFQQESERRAELSLLALTEQGASGTQQAIEQALGAAEALGLVAGLLDDPATCSEYLSRFAEDDDLYGFVGFLPREGPVTCSSAGEPFELGGGGGLAGIMAEPRLRVISLEGGTVTQGPALAVLVPLQAVEEGTGVPGYLGLAIPRDRLQSRLPGASQLRPLRLVTFNAEGEVLTSYGEPEDSSDASRYLPHDTGLALRATEEPLAFAGPDAQGEDRVFTVVPLVPGVTYALAAWTPEQAGRGIGGSPLLFPLLMWATSLIVAFWAIHRLVIARVGRLGARMRRFGRDRTLLPDPASASVPSELREIEETFRQMAGSILQDEARMENAFRERGVLLKEVHHRVKNNLQLISSIVSMQMRRMPDARERAILRRLQDRVLTLASIYRSLYTSPDMGDVNAAPVLRAIVEQELRAHPYRVEAVLDLDDIVLDPDKVVPLAFLTAETVSNAIGHADPREGRLKLSVALRREGDKATLLVSNSLDPREPPPGEAPGGLGQHLIRAFAAQIGGPVEAEVREGVYHLSLRFPIGVEAEAEARAPA